MAPPSPSSGDSFRPLPLDALSEVLLRLPAKDLCRFRAVCRPWRSLLSDPHFIAEHAVRHPEPLIVAAIDTDGFASNHLLDVMDRCGHLLEIMDLSGRVIKRVVRPWSLGALEKEWVMTAQLDVVCVMMQSVRSYLLFNPATGAVSALPQGFAEEHSQCISNCMQLIAFGKVASTGEYKVLRVLSGYLNQEQLCEVFTLDGSSHARWRGKKAAPDRVDFHERSRVTINGIVYFLSHELDMDQGVMPIRIASFDLETEGWRAILRGPLSLNRSTIRICDLSVASLNGYLVVIQHFQQSSSMDLWFLMDFEKGLWIKQYSIPLKMDSNYYYNFPAWPLLVLNDGRILYHEKMKFLCIYDPKTCTSTYVAEIGPYSEIGLYTGNLLSLPDGAGAQLIR